MKDIKKSKIIFIYFNKVIIIVDIRYILYVWYIYGGNNVKVCCYI